MAFEEIEIGLCKQHWEGMGRREMVPNDLLPFVLFSSPWSLGSVDGRAEGSVAIAHGLQPMGPVILIGKGGSESSRLDLCIICTLGRCNIENSNDGK